MVQRKLMWLTSNDGVQVGRDPIQAVVELVKTDYAVLSVPGHNHAVGFAAITDFNLQHSQAFQFALKHDQKINVSVAHLPDKATGAYD